MRPDGCRKLDVPSEGLFTRGQAFFFFGPSPAQDYLQGTALPCPGPTCDVHTGLLIRSVPISGEFNLVLRK